MLCKYSVNDLFLVRVQKNSVKNTKIDPLWKLNLKRHNLPRQQSIKKT